MRSNPKKDIIVNTQEERSVTNKTEEKIRKEETEKAPLAPFDPRNKKPGEPLQSNEDPLNGVNE